MGRINKLHNKLNETIYPISISHAVYMEDGTTTLHEELSNIKTDIDESASSIKAELKNDISNLETEIKDSISDLEVEFKNDISNLETELKNDIDELINNKYDDVILDKDGTLNFYANNVLIKSIILPVMSESVKRAVCGEFLSGQLLVGHNIPTSLSDVDLENPTTWIDNETPVNAFNMNTIENKIIALKNLINNKASGYHMGVEPPKDTSLIWVDTSDDEVDTTIDSSVLNELKLLISSMQEKINKLEEEVEYLKINGGGTIVPPIIEDGSYIITEDGDLIVTEDGENLILEEG